MAQEVTLMGATYSDVPSILLPDSNSTLHQFTDVTGTTATASDVASGKIFFASDGTETTGTASGGITPTGTLSITANGTYDVTNYASASVNVSGGGGSSSWTLVASTSYQVSTTSTSTATVATWVTGHSEIWTSDKIVYVRIRDTAGKRAGYWYGTDNFFLNQTPIYGDVTSTDRVVRFNIRYTTTTNGGKYETAMNSYGVFADRINDDGSIRIRSRYSSSYTLTINGTYSVEVYLLDMPTGKPIFT